MNFVVFLNGLVLMFFSALMLLNAAVFAETRATFFLSAVLTGLLGALLSIASANARRDLHRLHTFVLTSTVWISAAVAGAIPLHQWGLSIPDALFEAMSGITTTGSTVMVGLDTTARGILFWRAVLEAVGGIGFVVTGIALLPMLRVGGMQLFRTESSDKGEKELYRAASFATATLSVYLGLLGLCTLAYQIGGMSFFDAITHAMGTVSTGGLGNYDTSFAYFESPFLEWACTVFMLLGAVPFAWYIRMLNRGVFRSEQVEAMLKTLGLTIFGMTAWLVYTQGTEPLTALRLVAFNVVSVVTTTGFVTTDYLLWGPVAVAAFFCLTAVGGCTGSTSGGAKAMRWLILARAIRVEIGRVHVRHRAGTVRYEGKRVEDDVINGVISFFIVYAASFAVIALSLHFLGLDFATAASGALTSLANVGPGVGPIIGPAGNFAPLSDAATLILTLGMYLGRLEMLTVFVLLTPMFWREVEA